MIRQSITDLIKKQNIIKISLLFAIAFNIDKIVMGPHAPIRVSDAFNVTYPFLNVYISNVLKYKFISQAPEWLCGVTNSIYSPLLNYVLGGLIFSPYVNYVANAVVVKFIAFLGMFLLLHDNFNVDDKASFAGALFFSSIPTYLSEFNTVAGIPLLIWALEKTIDGQYPFKKKLLAFAYVIYYFLSSIFIDVSFVIVPFYFSYFLFVSKNEKTFKNIITISLIFSLYLLIYLPSLSELRFHSLMGHRVSWYPSHQISWVEAVKFFLGMFFYINMTDGATYAMPSLLGLLLIGYLVVSSKREQRDRYFIFPLVWILFVIFFAYFIVESPVWYSLKELFGVLKSFSFKRFHYISMVLYAILIGLASQRLIGKDSKISWRSFFIAWVIVFLYIGMGLVLKSKNILFAPEHWVMKLNSQLQIQLLALIAFFTFAVVAGIKKRSILNPNIIFIPMLLFAVLNYAHAIKWWGGGKVSYYNFFRSDEIEKVKEAEGKNIANFRVVGVGGVDPAQLLQNGFSCADGYYALYPQSYKEYWTKIIEPALKESKDTRDFFLGSGNYVYLYNSLIDDKLNFNIHLLRLAGVKYLFSGSRVKNYEQYDLMEIGVPENKKSPDEGWKKRFNKTLMFVYQNKEFAGPIFLTGTVKPMSKKEELLDELGRRDYDYLRANTLLLKDDIANVGAENINIEGAKINDFKLTPDWIRVNLNNQHPVFLNWTRNYNTNWHCLIDGKEAKIFRIYNTFMGVIVPSNSNMVEFKYINKNLSYAYQISILGFLVISSVVLFWMKKNSV